MGDQQLLVAKNNRTGRLTLNRPEALNALSYGMFEGLSAALADWQKDPQIYAVLLEAVGERFFCAGGDIREVHERAQKDPEEAARFLKREYRYNWQLDNFTKPHIALLNGKVLGGGVGISLYGTHRVAGEQFSLAMPETAIGFIPDVGGSWFLGHLPNSLGLYLALTGRPVARADALALGLVTHTIDSKDYPQIREALAKGEPVDPLLDGLQTDPGERELTPALLSWIEAVFSASTLGEIIQRAEALEEKSGGWSRDVLDCLAKKSPTSLHLAHRLWKKGRSLDLSRALDMEYAVVANLLREGDFLEGIRAMIIDKDKAPRWEPSDIAGVTRDRIDHLMQNRWGTLDLPARTA